MIEKYLNSDFYDPEIPCTPLFLSNMIPIILFYVLTCDTLKVFIFASSVFSTVSGIWWALDSYSIDK